MISRVCRDLVTGNHLSPPLSLSLSLPPPTQVSPQYYMKRVSRYHREEILEIDWIVLKKKTHCIHLSVHFLPFHWWQFIQHA